MNFEKILKKRLYYYIGCTIAGIILFVVSVVYAVLGREVMSAGFGLGISAVGLCLAIKTKKTLNDENALKKRAVMEMDERTVMINNKAKSIAFSIYSAITVISAIILDIINMDHIANSLAISICVLLILYVIVYNILEKKN